MIFLVYFLSYTLKNPQNSLSAIYLTYLIQIGRMEKNYCILKSGKKNCGGIFECF